ncbi:MAG TPA: SPOR domain-containing protein, partial [Candidatus Omnitrophota bacterium]|nr:SPOR domain-containing protein [Candidatus Omnitrophota bacterium]
MNSASKNQQIEFEVFPKDNNKSGYSYLSGIQSDTAHESQQINVVFSHQSVIVIFICAIMLLVASFSLGVEKGKLITKSAAVKEETTLAQAQAGAAAITASTEIKTPVGTALKPVQSSPAQTAAAQVKAPETTSQATAAVIAAPAITTGNYTIQIASVSSESAGKRLTETLAKKGIQAFTKVSGKYTIV